MKYRKGTFAVIPNVDKIKYLSKAETDLYIYLCMHADDKGQCFPSRKRLAELMKYKNPKSIGNLARRLEDLGFIKREVRKRKDGSNASNTYQIMIIDGGITTTGEGGMATAHEGGMATYCDGDINIPINIPEKYPLTYLKNISIEEANKFSKEYNCERGQVLEKAQAIVLYCESKGKKYKNYRSALQSWLLRDYGKRKKETWI